MGLRANFYKVHYYSLGQSYLPNFIEIGQAISVPGEVDFGDRYK